MNKHFDKGGLRAMALRAKSGLHRMIFGGAMVTLMPLMLTSCHSSTNDAALQEINKLKTENRKDFDAFFTRMDPKLMKVYEGLLAIQLSKLDEDQINDNFKEFESRFFQGMSDFVVHNDINLDVNGVLNKTSMRDSKIAMLREDGITRDGIDIMLCIICIYITVNCLLRVLTGPGKDDDYMSKWGFYSNILIAWAITFSLFYIPSRFTSYQKLMRKTKEIMYEENCEKLKNDVQTYYLQSKKNDFQH